MTDPKITQAEADALMKMEKHRSDDTQWDYPDLGRHVTIPLTSADRREPFLLDLRKGSINLTKGTYQTRARQIVILARLDFGGAPHRNPDGEEIASPHLHLYREGFGDKWAIPVPSEHFSSPNDAWQMLEDFMRYCNITKPPMIQRGLFA